MCWQSKKVPVKMVAEEDIKVNKVLFLGDDNILRSPLTGFMWDKNKLYTTELDAVSYYTPMYYIHKGFHTANSIHVHASCEYWASFYNNSDYLLFAQAE